MFVIKSDNIDTMIKENICAQYAEIKRILTHNNPELCDTSDLDKRIKNVVDWSIDKNITNKSDIFIIADLVIAQNLRIMEDQVLTRLLQSDTPPYVDIMLRYLAEKPADFWRT